MGIEQALILRLVAAETLADARVHGGGVASRLSAMPLITLELAGGAVECTHDGEVTSLQTDTFLVTAWSAGYLEAIELAAACREALAVGGWEPDPADNVEVHTCFVRNKRDRTFDDVENGQAFYGRELTVEITYGECEPPGGSGSEES